jgi:hypothetical protein
MALSVAAAQERPLLRPSRDVEAAYRVQSAGSNGQAETRTVRMYWTGQGSRMRLETEGQPGFVLIDFDHQRATMVMLARKIYAEMKFDAEHAPGLHIPPGATVDRVGSDTVAGIACTEWQIKGSQGGGTACITNDGLLLRVRGSQPGEPVALEAVSVTYAPQPASLFTLPDGLRQVAPQ